MPTPSETGWLRSGVRDTFGVDGANLSVDGDGLCVDDSCLCVGDGVYVDGVYMDGDGLPVDGASLSVDDAGVYVDGASVANGSGLCECRHGCHAPLDSDDGCTVSLTSNTVPPYLNGS